MQGPQNAVKAYLRAQGIDERRLTTIGYGPSSPATDNLTPEHRQQNRRTEFQRTDSGAASCPSFNPRPAPPAIGLNPRCAPR